MSLGTKVLSARVPFEFYVKFLEEAQRNGLSVSDYVIIKLQENRVREQDNDAVTKLTKEINHLKNDYKIIMLQKIDLEEINNKWEKDYQSIYDTKRLLQQKLKLYQERYGEFK
jgi:3-dehydroquinate synthase class II